MSKFLAILRFVLVALLFVGTVARAEHVAVSALMALHSIGIINGRDAGEKEYPGVAKLFKFTIEDGQVLEASTCSTAIINGCVVSAAHCFLSTSKTEFVRFPNGDVANIKRDGMKLLSRKDPTGQQASGIDIAVVKLDRRPKQGYTTEILASTRLPEWEDKPVKTSEDFARVKGKGHPGTLVAYGRTFSETLELKRIALLPKAEQAAPMAALQEKIRDDLKTVRKQVGSFEILGPTDVVAFSDLLDRIDAAKAAVGAQPEGAARTKQLAEIAETEKMLKANRAYVAYGTPSSVAHGDSGGPVFAADENGVERFVGIAESGDEISKSSISPIFENRKWITDQLTALGCTDEAPPAPPKSFDEMKP